MFSLSSLLLENSLQQIYCWFLRWVASNLRSLGLKAFQRISGYLSQRGTSFLENCLNELCYFDWRTGTWRFSLFPGVTQRIFVFIYRLDCLTFEDEKDILSRNVGNYQTRLRDSQREPRFHLYRCAWNYARGTLLWFHNNINNNNNNNNNNNLNLFTCTNIQGRGA